MSRNTNDYTSCIKCGSPNMLSHKEHFAGVLCEVKTVCTNETCKHEDCWAYGYYESSSDEVSDENIGSSFDSFLEEEGILDKVNEAIEQERK